MLTSSQGARAPTLSQPVPGRKTAFLPPAGRRASGGLSVIHVVPVVHHLATSSLQVVHRVQACAVITIVDRSSPERAERVAPSEPLPRAPALL